MNNSAKLKATALILALCTLFSIIAVLPISAATVNADGNYANRADTTDEEVITYVLNRDFEDLTVIQNGGSLSSNTALGAMEKVKEDGNTFVRFTNNGAHDYIYYNLANYTPESGSVVVQLDVMVEENTASVPSFIQLNPKVRGAASDIYTLATINRSGGQSALTSAGGAATNYKMNAGEWYTVTFVWSYTSKEEVLCTIYSGAGPTVSLTDRAADGADGCTDVRPGQIRIGTSASAVGTWCLDNVIIYTVNTTDPEVAASRNVLSSYRGVAYNENADKYIPNYVFSGNAFMKVGVLRALNQIDTAITIPEAPFKHSGKVYIPTSSLAEIDIYPTSSIEEIEGVECIRIDKVEDATGGIRAIYSSMGLICFTSDSEATLDGLDVELIPTMQKFIFESITDKRANANAFSYEDIENPTHPYLYADQARFDELAAVYESKEEETLYSYLESLVNSAESTYKRYAKTSSNQYVSLNTSVGIISGQSSLESIPYVNAYGYDVGGRLNEAAGHTERIAQLAFAYQITKDTKYARLAYDYAIALGKWEHWGPGHFLNCADASAPYAIAYDWLYTIWCELGLDVEKIEEIIFTHSILPAFYSIHDNGCPWYDPVVSTGWRFHTHENNWNAVCSSGVTLASLVLAGSTKSAAGTKIDITIDGVCNADTETYASTSGTITRKDGKTFTTNQVGYTTYRDYCEYLVNQCLYNLPMYGLGQYAPDGSYIESNGYWSYGTNAFFEMTAALVSSTGGDYGLLDTWGIDRTAYFALNTQSGDYQGWNYHDSNSTGPQDTSWFSFLGSSDGLDDKALIGIRKRILSLADNVSPSRYDAIYYMTDEEIGEFTLPDLQYYMEGIDGYVIRDSWDRESIYAGILGNSNTVSHGQIDSGGFVYHNGGTIWFCDVGTENYNTYGFWNTSTRYTYYKMNAEGNNVLLLTSQQHTMPYGQSADGFGAMTHTFSNEYGAYAIIDNTTVYGACAKYAYRGMMLTSDRKTFVIQDEVSFTSPQDAVWVGHTEQEIMLSTDGTQAYMYDGENVIKVTLINNDGTPLKFEVIDTYDFLLDCTAGPNYSVSMGGVAENDRSTYKRLIIRFDDVTSINVAVAIEEVAISQTMNGDTGYSFTPMHDWVPTKDGRQKNFTAASFGFEGDDLGQILCDGVSYSTVTVGNSHAALIIPTVENGTLTFSALNKLAEYGTLGLGYLTAELDISSSALVKIGIITNGGKLLNLPIEISDTSFTRISLVLDLKNCTAYCFGDDRLSTKIPFAHASFENLGIFLNIVSSDSETTLVDNVKVRYFKDGYAELDEALANGDISLWKDRGEITSATENSVAKITYADGSALDAPSFAALCEMITKDSHVELFADNDSFPFEITCPCTVDTNGFRLGATSPSYSAFCNGDTVTYAVGEITVKWVIGTETITEIYTGSVAAVYKGDVPENIYETDNGDGTYSYYVMNGWSRTDGGEPLDALDMTVTSQNNTFYVTSERYRGAFVTVKNGVIKGYDNISNLFSTSVLRNLGADRISLTNDAYYDSTGISDSVSITKAAIYLNGYTLTYYSKDSSDHMFTVGNTSSDFSIHGPGTIENESTSSNIIYQQGPFCAENVNFVSKIVLADSRKCTGHYKNCTITITGSASAFSVINRNNAVKNEEEMPYVLLDGCNVNIPNIGASTPVFSVMANARLELNGGTHVNTNSKGCLFRLSNSYVSNDGTYDYTTGTDYMAVKLGDCHFSVSALYTNATTDTTQQYDMGERIMYTAGAQLEEFSTGGIGLEAGLLIARQANRSFPYVVAREEDCSLVTWVIDGVEHSEFWVSSEMPTPDSSAVKNIISAHPAADGYRYVFENVTLSGGYQYRISAEEIKNVDILMNMTLHAEFNVNFYVEKNVDGIEFIGYYLDGEYFTFENTGTVTRDGKVYYRVIKYAISPSSAAKSIEFDVVIRADGKEFVLSNKASVVAYSNVILSSDEYTAEAKMLMANILKYIEAAYAYENLVGTEEYTELYKTYEKHKAYATASVVNRAEANLENIADGIRGVYLKLSNTTYYGFILNENYTGNIKITYITSDEKGNLNETVKSYSVVKGKCNGLSYVQIERKVYDLPFDVRIETDGGEGVYNLAIYYHYTATDLGKTTNLLNALYAYCECAKIYNDSIAVK